MTDRVLLATALAGFRHALRAMGIRPAQLPPDLLSRSQAQPVTELRWLLNGEPVPPGWRLVGGPACHHDAHAQLIERVEATR